MVLNQTSLVICGPSGDGKTTMARELCKKAKIKTYVVNGDKADFAGSLFKIIDWDESLSMKFADCCIIYEDVNLPSEKALKIIRKHVVQTRRHNNCSVILIIHSIKSNNVSSNLLNQFMFVAFTRSDRNSKNWIDFTRECTAVGAEDARLVWKELEEDYPQRAYLVFDLHCSCYFVCDKRGFVANKRGAVGRKGLQDPEALEAVRRSVVKYLPDHNKSAAVLLFDYLFSPGGVPIAQVGSKLELRYKNQSVHLLDLLHTATSSDNRHISPQMISIFGMLKKRANLPDCLILNSKFKAIDRQRQ